MRRSAPGVVIVTVLLALMVVMFLATAMVTEVGRTFGLTRQLDARTRARWLAEGGAEEVFAKLCSSASFASQYVGTGLSYARTYPDGGSFTVVVRDLGGSLVSVDSIGSQGQVQQMAFLTLSRSGAQSGYAGVANRIMLGNFSETDAWDSGRGTYDSTKQSGGDLATNSVSFQAVDLVNNSKVRGQILVGQGGNVDTVIFSRNGSSFTSAAALPRAVPEPAVTIPSGDGTSVNLVGEQQTLPPGTYSVATISNGSTLTLGAGTYVFDQLSFGNFSSLVVKGKVKVYVRALLSVAQGSRVNTTGVPKDLLFCLGSGALANLTGNSELRGQIYGPNSMVELNNAQVFGSVVADSLDLGNANIHYDLALGSPAGGPPTPGFTGFQRTSFGFTRPVAGQP